MKHCFACGANFDTDGWQCTTCGALPQTIEGFPQISVGLDAANAFPAEAHDALDLQQERSFWFRQRNALILQLLACHFRKAQSLLEVGCGTGFVLDGIRAAHPAMRCAGGEIFLSGLRAARRRLGADTLLLRMDARRIPFREEFDLVAAFDVLEHIEDDRAALAEIFRAVKPGGGILLSVPQHPWLWSRADDVACHQRRYRRGELARKVREAGFEILFQTSFVTTLLPAFILQRFLERRNPDAAPGAGLTPPAPVNAALEAVLTFERLVIRCGFRLPLGSSRFLVARRPDGT
jgi:SAM-dependent methyltransferase